MYTYICRYYIYLHICIHIYVGTRGAGANDSEVRTRGLQNMFCCVCTCSKGASWQVRVHNARLPTVFCSVL